MTRKYIGLLDESKLQQMNFTKISNDTNFKDCITLAKGREKPYIAIKPLEEEEAGDAIELAGECYAGDFDPQTVRDVKNGDFEVYSVPKNCPNNSDDCLMKNINKDYWKDQTRELELEIADTQRKLRAAKIKNYEISQGLSPEQAQQKLREKELCKKNEELKNQLATINAYYESVTSSSSNSNKLLADKNRLIAGVNSSIQQKYTRLSEVNSEINTSTQEIYENNLAFERKQQIIKTMKAIVTVLFIMLLIMIVYYGVRYAQQQYPDTFNNALNTLGSNPFGANPF